MKPPPDAPIVELTVQEARDLVDVTNHDALAHELDLAQGSAHANEDQYVIIKIKGQNGL